MLADFYEFTMANGYIKNDMGDRIAVFDMFFRKVPDRGGFAIMAGLENLMEYLSSLSFSEEDIEYFRSKNMFSEEFLSFIRGFKFECDVWAVEEGTPIFPGEPIIIVKGPVKQAQLIETMVLLTINHQSLIATKASRIVRAAKGRSVSEFGSRRAQGTVAATLGARAAYIGGADGTANTLADRLYGIPAVGTMAHSWVQLFDCEEEAFRAYAQTYKDKCLLLVDTYDVLKSGIPNAIKIFDEELKPYGYRPVGVRIDSGDLAYLSKEARKMLDAAGYEDAKIFVSNSLDEYVIKDLLNQGAEIDSFGVGERLITSKSEPVFGGVYKLVSVYKDGIEVPKIKISEDVEKITTPAFKDLYRLYDKDSKKAIADLVCLKGEEIDGEEIEIFHPLYTWKRKVLRNFEAKKLLKKIFDKGKIVYEKKSIEEIRRYSEDEIDKLWDEVKRLENPHEYIVDLSEKLWKIKDDLLKKKRQ